MEIIQQRINEELCEGELGERIAYLLKNPDLGNKGLIHHPYRDKTYFFHPESFSAVLFVLNLEKKFIEHVKAEYNAQCKKLEDMNYVEIVPNNNPQRLPNFCFFPEAFDRPGYVMQNSMKIFLEDIYERVEKPKPKKRKGKNSTPKSRKREKFLMPRPKYLDLIVYHDAFVYWPEHAALYLGALNGEGYVFTQGYDDREYKIEKLRTARPFSVARKYGLNWPYRLKDISGEQVKK